MELSQVVLLLVLSLPGVMLNYNFAPCDSLKLKDAKLRKICGELETTATTKPTVPIKSDDDCHVLRDPELIDVCEKLKRTEEVINKSLNKVKTTKKPLPPETTTTTTTKTTVTTTTTTASTTTLPTTTSTAKKLSSTSMLTILKIRSVKFTTSTPKPSSTRKLKVDSTTKTFNSTIVDHYSSSTNLKLHSNKTTIKWQPTTKQAGNTIPSTANRDNNKTEPTNFNELTPVLIPKKRLKKNNKIYRTASSTDKNDSSASVRYTGESQPMFLIFTFLTWFWLF